MSVEGRRADEEISSGNFLLPLIHFFCSLAFDLTGISTCRSTLFAHKRGLCQIFLLGFSFNPSLFVILFFLFSFFFTFFFFSIFFSFSPSPLVSCFGPLLFVVELPSRPFPFLFLVEHFLVFFSQ